MCGELNGLVKSQSARLWKRKLMRFNPIARGKADRCRYRERRLKVSLCSPVTGLECRQLVSHGLVSGCHPWPDTGSPRKPRLCTKRTPLQMVRYFRVQQAHYYYYAACNCQRERTNDSAVDGPTRPLSEHVANSHVEVGLTCFKHRFPINENAGPLGIALCN